MWTLITTGIIVILFVITGLMTSFTGGGSGAGNIFTFLVGFFGFIILIFVGIAEFIYKKFIRKRDIHD